MASMELREATFEKRFSWIEEKKEEGNTDFKKKNFEAAIDSYLASLCGFAFKKDIKAE